MEFLPTEKNGRKVYAGFWKRFGAGIVDMVVFIPFVFLFNLQNISLAVAMLTAVVWYALYYAYVVYFHYKFGATLGKMATGVRVTLPNGGRIGLKQALLRSSVDIGFGIFAVAAQVIALSNADADQYLNAGWLDRSTYLIPLLPAWYGIVNMGSTVWYWSEFIVLLFNRRKRSLHDFIAGTVVIHQEHAEQGIRKALNPASAG